MKARLVRITVVTAVLGTMLGACANETSPGSPDPTSPSASVTATPTDAVEVTIARSGGPLLQTGDTIPEFSAPALDGGVFTWSDYLGTPTVLAVWASWCPHCQVELPRLDAAVNGHPGLQLVSVTTATGMAEGAPTPQEYMDSQGLTFPVAIDDEQVTLMTGLGVTSFPTVFFVDASGTVVAATTGEMDPAALERILADLESASS
jgi:Peroxiredoxin